MELSNITIHSWMDPGSYGYEHYLYMLRVEDEVLIFRDRGEMVEWLAGQDVHGIAAVACCGDRQEGWVFAWSIGKVMGCQWSVRALDHTAKLLSKPESLSLRRDVLRRHALLDIEPV